MSVPCWCGQDKESQLSELARDKFEDLLRSLTAERAAVRDAMVFALDHAECAAEVQPRSQTNVHHRLHCQVAGTPNKRLWR